MKFCSQCGKEIMNEAVICPNCGSAVGKLNTVGDSSGLAWSIISFLFPLLGIILYLVWRDDRPLRSKSLLNGIKAILIIYGVVIIFMIIMGVISAISLTKSPGLMR